jgi:hypothetical protein
MAATAIAMARYVFPSRWTYSKHDIVVANSSYILFCRAFGVMFLEAINTCKKTSSTAGDIVAEYLNGKYYIAL